nr:PTS lactose/cellobiose transporter subunit IIA [Enterococcus sp. 669A]
MSDKMTQEQLEAIMGLIMNSGNAKSNAMEAIQAAKKNDFELAKTKLAEADEALVEAHHAQTGLLTKEAQGDQMTVTLLAVHSQDHLMTSITFNDLAKEVVDIYQRLADE